MSREIFTNFPKFILMKKVKSFWHRCQSFFKYKSFKTNEDINQGFFKCNKYKTRSVKFYQKCFTTCNYRKNDKCPAWELRAKNISMIILKKLFIMIML